MKVDRFTVVIPTKNEEKFIAQCLQSVQVECGDCLDEIIVVDNGSTDRTRMVAEQMGARVLVCNGTIATQRNTGARVAKTEVIAFLDADCTVKQGWAKHAIAWFDEDEIVAVGAKPVPPDDDATWVQSAWCFIKKSPKTVPSSVSWLSSCNLWVRKSSFDNCNGFDESFETCEDVDLGYRISNLGKLVSDPGIAVVHYREPSTLIQFYNKEIWHGKNSYDGIFSGRFRVHELPSLLAPLVFGLGLLVLFASALIVAVYGRIFWSIFALIVTLLVPFIFATRVHIRKGQWDRLPSVFILYVVYFLARFTAFLKWMVRR